MSVEPVVGNVTGRHHVKELLGGSSLTMLGRLVGMAAFYGTSVVVARWYGIDQYGRFALGVAAVSLGSVVAKLGVDLALMKLHSAYVADENFGATRSLHRQALRLVAFTGLCVSIGVVVAGQPLADNALGEPGLAGTFRAAAMAIPPLALLNVLSSSLRGFRRLPLFAWSKFAAAQVATLLFICGSHALGLGISPIWSYVAAVWSACTITAILVARSFAAAPRDDRHRPAPVRDLLRLSMPLVLAASGWVLIEWTDSVLLAVFEGEAEVGAYQAAYRLASVIATPVLVVNATVASQFAVLHDKDERSALADLAQVSSVVMAALTLPAALALTVAPGVFLSMFGGGADMAVTTLVVLVVAQVVNVCAGSVASVLGMADGQRTLGTITIVTLLANIALNLVFIPRWGLEGAAVAQLASMVWFNGTALLAVRRQLGFWACVTPVGIARTARRGTRSLARVLRRRDRKVESAD